MITRQVVMVGMMLLAACADSSEGTGGQPDDGDASAADELSQFMGGDSGPPVSMGCSGDLHRVVDGAGNTITTCPDDQGCSKGVCVPACQAAADSHGNLGCDFMVSTPQFGFNAPPCFTAILTNGWTKAAHVMLSRDGVTFDPTAFIRIATSDPDATKWPLVDAAGVPPNQTGIAFLGGDPTSGSQYGEKLGCPVPDAVSSGTEVTGTGRGKAFHITTDVPVSATDLLPFGGAATYLPGASLLLPTTAWGTNYVAIATPPYSGNHRYDPDSASTQFLQVIGASDATTVTVLASVDLPSGTGVAAAVHGAPQTYTLGAGEYLQWYGEGLKLSGTVVTSDKPVIIETGGGLCLGSKTSSGGGCDNDHDVIPPVSALGSEYVAAPYTTRQLDLSEESIVYRILGTVDGTKLTYDPPISGAPMTLAAGELQQVETVGGFRISSQDAAHPFYVAQLMSGCYVSSGSRPGCANVQMGDPGYGCLGDEDHVGLVPPAQFLTHYVFFADPTYGTTTVTAVRKRTSSGFKDVRIDCIGTLSGWKPVGTTGDYEMTSVDLRRTNSKDADASVLPCSNGGHVADGDGPFGFTVWGLDHAASYGYPAGGNAAAINGVVVPVVPR